MDTATELSCKSEYVTVLGSKIHYLQAGKGDPILFLHGIPTSSFLWRNIIPTLAKHGHCIAPDLIGMGKSDKPDIEYRIFDHIKYIDAFIAALGLKRITLVLHGWGSVIGFNYAANHEDNIKGLAFYESQVRAAVRWDMLSLLEQQLGTLLKDKEKSYKAVIENNFFIDKLLPRSVLRELTKEELAQYGEPFHHQASRKVLWQFVLDRPFGNGPSDVTKLIDHYSAWLQKTTLPKLMMYTIPGFITPVSSILWCKEHFPNITITDLGEGLHFMQETNPKIFSEKLLDWYLKIS